MLFLLALPRPILIRLAGGDTHAMVVLAAGILLAVGTAGLALLALGAQGHAGVTWAQIVALVATLATMVLLRDQVRQLALREAGFEPPAWVVAQWGPFAVFAVLLVVAVATIAWMARTLARGAASPR